MCLEFMELLAVVPSNCAPNQKPITVESRHYTICITCSGVGTVAFIAALGGTLFNLKINIHNLL